MDMPGFTAETSVYVTHNRYFGAADYIALGGGVVITAAIFLRGGYRYCSQICQGDPDCIQCCMCLAHGGHPSQCCF